MADTIQQQLDWATQALTSISDSPRLDSEILLAYCLHKDRSYLMTWPDKTLEAERIDCFRDLVQRRLEPQPVAYLVGSREFYSLELKTTPETLVPRPETEMFVDMVLELVETLDEPHILELGTGTGAIALSIKQHNPQSHVIATDESSPALSIARENALKHKLDIRFIESDWFQSLDKMASFDVVVSNPPYIAEDDPYLTQGDLPAEPLQALSSGPNGLEAIEIIIKESLPYLKDFGWIVLEHGYQQGLAVNELLVENGYTNVTLYKDFNNLDRLTVASKNPA